MARSRNAVRTVTGGIAAVARPVGRGLRKLKAACSRHARAALIGWGVVVLVLVVGVGTLWWANSRYDHIDTARKDASNAARAQSVEVLSYSFDTLDNDMQRAQGNLTGEFRDKFSQMATNLIEPAAKQQQINTKAEVKDAAIVHANTDEVVILLFVNQVTRSKQQDKPKNDGSRLKVTMRQAEGKWKIADLEPV